MLQPISNCGGQKRTSAQIQQPYYLGLSTRCKNWGKTSVWGQAFSAWHQWDWISRRYWHWNWQNIQLKPKESTKVWTFRGCVPNHGCTPLYSYCVNCTYNCLKPVVASQLHYCDLLWDFTVSVGGELWHSSPHSCFLYLKLFSLDFEDSIHVYFFTVFFHHSRQ